MATVYYLIDQVSGDIAAVIADGAYDTRPFCNAVTSRGADPVIPPIKTAKAGGSACPARDRTVLQVQKLGQRHWKKESAHHRQGWVENTVFRYKRISGGKLRARGRKAQEVEARIARQHAQQDVRVVAGGSAAASINLLLRCLLLRSAMEWLVFL